MRRKSPGRTHPEGATATEGSARVLITLGDPAGIGPEVVLKSLIALRRSGHPELSRRMTVIGDRSFLQGLAQRLKLRVPWSQFDWIDLPNAGSIRPGHPGIESGRAAFSYIEEAIRRLKKGQGDALVTAPVSKETIAGAGVPWRGHTEHLADAFRCRTTMMFVTGRFRVSLVTTHCAIRDLPARLRRGEVARVIEATRRAMSRDFGIRRPRIGLAALNPHGGEGGMFGGEEKSILLPAVRASTRSARTVRRRSAHPELVEGWRIDGPLPSDSLMQAAARGEYDAVVALYHDQALIPVKLIGWHQAVNVTLGLPFARTSPVHGTAFDIAGKGKADPSSMRAAIDLAVQWARRRAH